MVERKLVRAQDTVSQPRPEPGTEQLSVAEVLFRTGVAERALGVLSQQGRIDSRRNFASYQISVKPTRPEFRQPVGVLLILSYESESPTPPGWDTLVTREFTVGADSESWLRGDKGIRAQDYKVMEMLAQGVPPSDVMQQSTAGESRVREPFNSTRNQPPHQEKTS